MPFDPKEYLAKKKSQTSGFDPKAYLDKKASETVDGTLRQGSWSETSPVIQKLKALGYGTNLPGSSEIAGLIGKLKGQDYKEAQNIYKANAELSQHENPSEYGAGSLLGGAAMAVLPEAKIAQGLPLIGKAASAFSKLANPAKAAIFGGVQGAEASNVDVIGGVPLTGESLQQLGKDIAIPAAAGAGLAGIPALVKGTVDKTPIANSSYGKVFKKAYEEGVDLSDKKVLNQLATQKLNLADDISNKILADAKQNAMLKGSLIEKHGQVPVNLGEARSFADEAISKLSPDLKENKELISQIKQKLNQAFKDTEEIKQRPVTTSEVTKIPYEKSMREKLEEKIADQKLKDEDLGINARYEINPVKNELGQSRLKVNKYVDDVPSYSPEKLVKEIGEDGKPTGYKVLDPESQQPSIDTSAQVTGIYPDIEATGGYKKFTPSTVMEDYSQLTKHPEQYTLEEANQVRKNLAEVLKKNKVQLSPMGDIKNIVHSPLEQTLGKVSNVINESTPEISSVNKQIIKRGEIADALGLGKLKGEDIEDLALKDKMDLNKPLRQLSNPAETSVEEAQNRITNQNQLSKSLKEYNPELSDKFDKMKNLSEDLSTGDMVDNGVDQLAYRSGRIKAVAKQVAGKGGMYLGKIANTPPVVTSSFTNLGVSPTFGDMTTEQKLELAKQLRSQNNAGVAVKVEKAAASNDPIDHAQADFVLGQTGGSRKKVQEYGQ